MHSSFPRIYFDNETIWLNLLHSSYINASQMIFRLLLKLRIGLSRARYISQVHGCTVHLCVLLKEKARILLSFRFPISRVFQHAGFRSESVYLWCLCIHMYTFVHVRGMYSAITLENRSVETNSRDAGDLWNDRWKEVSAMYALILHV